MQKSDMLQMPYVLIHLSLLSRSPVSLLPSTPSVTSPFHLVDGSWTEKSSWWGCGDHVPSVMDPISEGDRCTCEPKVEKGGKMYPPKAEKAD